MRHAFYFPAVVAGRFNLDLQTVYEPLIAAGKPKKVAIIGFVRRLIIVAIASFEKTDRGPKIALKEHRYSKIRASEKLGAVRFNDFSCFDPPVE